MADKIKFAFLLTGGCAGCEMSLVDLSESLVDVLDHLEVVFWAPTVADVKYKDLEAMPDQSIDLAFVDGMIRLSEHEHMAKVLRSKAKVLVAFGVCASLGGVAGMANLHPRKALFDTAYIDSPSTDNPEGIYPQPKCVVDGKYELTLPEFCDRVRPLTDVVTVDYMVGGCPPHHEFVAKLVTAIVEGNLPAKGSWLTGGKAVCDVCDRNPANEQVNRKTITEVKRVVDGNGVLEEKECLLQGGYLCLGAVTQGDCNASCPKVNIPCRGCGGPMPGVTDFGAQALSSIGAILENEEVAERMVAKYPDMAKMMYRYSLPASLLGRKIKGQ
ncbi:MAG: F420-nonreducing hydrogenase [Proteobacteria bacterium]|nr:F420-nonreducing hydrogenase [Pseudomonadota bacterium]